MPKIVDHVEQRRRIAGAALEIVADRGLAALTMREVAKAADCSTGMVNHYFESKHTLIVAAAREATRRLSDGFFTRPHRRAPGPELLRKYLLAMLPLKEQEDQPHRVFVHLYSAAVNDPMIAEVARGYLDDAIAHVARLLAEGQREGWVATDVDVVTAGHVIVAAVDALGIHHLLGIEGTNQAGLAARVDQVVTQFITPPAGRAVASTARKR